MLEQFQGSISKYAAEFRVPEVWIKGVIMAESSGNPQAFRAEPQINDASRGLMQLLYKTAKGLGYTGTPEGLFDPDTSIRLGTKLLSQGRAAFGDDLRAVYSWYNSGNADLYKTSSTVAANVARVLGYVEDFLHSEPLIAGSGAALLVVGVLLALGTNEGKAEKMRIDAASMERADVVTALQRCNGGDTVVLPAGQAIWREGYSQAMPPGSSIVGASVAAGVLEVGGGDASKIIDQVNRQGYDAAVLEVILAGQNFRLAGLTVQSVGDISYNGLVRLWGGSPQLRVDHMHFAGGVTGLLFGGQQYGVCDSSHFEFSAIRHYAGDWGGHQFGDGSWAEPSTFGSDRFIFVEDCVLEGDGGAMDSYQGSRWVYRYNHFINGGVQTHPTGGSGRARGTRCFEAYENFFEGTKNNFNVVWISSGTGLVFRNRVTPMTYDYFMTLHEMRRGPSSSNYGQLPTPAGWGYCGLSVDGIGSAWDGNQDPNTGYPGIDQPGRGMGALLSGEFPNAVNTATGVISSPDQQHEPVYEWENDWSGYGSKVAIHEPEMIQIGRDIMTETALPGYSPYVYPHPLRAGEAPTPVPPKKKAKKTKIKMSIQLEAEITEVSSSSAEQ